MKKQNLFRTFLAAMFMCCFMAVAFMCTNIDAKAATLEIEVSGSSVHLLENGQRVTNTVVNVLSATKNNGYTLNPGYYYFNQYGVAADLESAYAIKPVVNYTSSGLTNPTNLYVAKGTATSSAINISTKIFSANCKLYTGFPGAAFVYNGAPYTGFYWDSASKTLFYMVNGNGAVVNGVATGSYYHTNNKRICAFPTGGFYAVNGKLSTGVYNKQYYVNGSIANVTGWATINGAIYYISNGQALTGWQKLPSYGGGVLSYKYLFNDQGVMYTDLIDYYGYDKFIQMDIMIKSNKTTHNTTFYFKDASGEYVPAKTIICATARKKGDTPTGTFRLEKTWNRRWYVYKKTHGAPWRYYQWAVKIKGTSSLYHSSTYRKKSATSLRVDLYNKLGTSCTTHCIRHQAYYAKMIYDIATKTNKKKRVPVQILNTSNEGPFGHVSLTKVSSGTKWDPTDPNKK